jgi:hypothetical protein
LLVAKGCSSHTFADRRVVSQHAVEKHVVDLGQAGLPAEPAAHRRVMAVPAFLEGAHAQTTEPRIGSIATLASTNLLLTTGEQLPVRGTLEDVQKRLQDAVRSSPGSLALLTEATTGEQIGVNPAHVVTLRQQPLQEE